VVFKVVMHNLGSCMIWDLATRADNVGEHGNHGLTSEVTSETAASVRSKLHDRPVLDVNAVVRLISRAAPVQSETP